MSNFFYAEWLFTLFIVLSSVLVFSSVDVHVSVTLSFVLPCVPMDGGWHVIGLVWSFYIAIECSLLNVDYLMAPSLIVKSWF